MCRQSGDWTTASQRSASFSYSHGNASDAGAASQAAHGADVFAADSDAAASPSLDLVAASYAASDQTYTASEASFWQRSATGSHAGSAGMASAPGSRPSSAHQGASVAPDSPISSSAVSYSAEDDDASSAVGIRMDSGTLSAKRTATRTASLSARSMASRASSLAGDRASGAPLDSADRQLAAGELDDIASNASLSSWAAAASDRLEPADEALTVDAAEDRNDYADPASLTATAEADLAAQHSSQLPEAGSDGASNDGSPADAAKEGGAELDAAAPAIARRTDANEPSEVAAVDVAADEEGVESEWRNSGALLHGSNDGEADMDAAGREAAQPEATWGDQSQTQDAAGLGSDAGAFELSEGGQDELAAGAAAAQLLMPLPERDHINLAAAAAATEQLPSGCRLSVTGTGISMDGALQARARLPA